MEAADGYCLRPAIACCPNGRGDATPRSPAAPSSSNSTRILARLKAEFSIKQGTVRRDFLEKEATVYYTCYKPGYKPPKR